MVLRVDRHIIIPSSREESSTLESLRSWLGKQYHLPFLSDDEALLFLHNRRYSVEKTKTMIDSYFTLRAHIPEVFTGRDTNVNSLVKCLDVFACVMLPEKTPLGANIIIHRLIKTEANEFDILNAVRTEMSVVDIKLREAGRVSGSHIVFDCTNASLMHILKFSAYLSLIRRIFTFAKVALPLNILGVHFINCTLIDQISIFLKPLLKRDLSGSVHFYGRSDLDKFHEFIPKKICPEDYGGMAPSIAELNNEIKSTLLENQSFLKSLNECVISEKVKPIALKKLDDGLGIPGSFKKLTLD